MQANMLAVSVNSNDKPTQESKSGPEAVPNKVTPPILNCPVIIRENATPVKIDLPIEVPKPPPSIFKPVTTYPVGNNSLAKLILDAEEANDAYRTIMTTRSLQCPVCLNAFYSFKNVKRHFKNVHAKGVILEEMNSTPSKNDQNLDDFFSTIGEGQDIKEEVDEEEDMVHKG